MIREDLKSLLFKLENLIKANKDFAVLEKNFPKCRKVSETLNILQQELEQHTQQHEQKKQLELLVHSIPAAVAILDKHMCYVSISDRWTEYFQLDRQSIIGQNHYEVFPQIPDSWRQSDLDCLTGKVAAINREEDFVVLNNGTANVQADCLNWQVLPWNNSQGEIVGLLMSTEVITEKHLLQKKIESCEAQMRSIFAGMDELVFTLDQSSDTILFLPTKFFEIYSDSIVNQIIEQTHAQLFASDDAKNYQDQIHQILQTQTPIEFEYSLQLEDSLIWYGAKVSPTSNNTVIWIARDITNRKEIEHNNLFIEQELAHVTLQSIGEGVIRTDALGVVQYINPIAEKLTGWNAEEAKGCSLKEMFQIVNQSIKKPVVNPIKQVKSQNQTYRLAPKNILIARNGKKYAIEGVASPINNRQGELFGVVIVFRDVSQSRKIAQKLSWQATHDPLTKLYNRRKFEEKVTNAIKKLKEIALTMHFAT